MSEKDIIAEQLGLDPISSGRSVSHPTEYLDYEIVDDPLPEDKDTVKDDVEIVRENIRKMLEEGTEALSELFTIAKASESPKAFEAASTLLKSLTDAGKGLIDASKEKRAVILQEKGPQTEGPKTVTNNNTLVMSTSEFLKMIRDKKKKAESDGEE